METKAIMCHSRGTLHAQSPGNTAIMQEMTILLEAPFPIIPCGGATVARAADELVTIYISRYLRAARHGRVRYRDIVTGNCGVCLYYTTFDLSSSPSDPWARESIIW